MTKCFNHEERDAAGRCAVCGKSVCEECVVVAGNMNFCSAECRDKAASSRAISEDVLARKAKTDSASLVRRLIYVFVVILAIAAAYYFYAQNEKTVDSKIKRSVKKFEKETSGAVKEVKKAIPTSSKAKRQRENLVK